ncbi:F-box domain-containing protein [Hirschfeldia incana]|nr:F-box domain-containing protein [Hirschfeldia incana]
MSLSYNADDEPPPAKHTTHPPPLPSSLSSLPDEILLRCIALVPRSYHLSLSWVSKHLRSLVRSLPELNGIQQSTLPKNSLHVCLEVKYDDYDDEEEEDDSFFHWFTLNETSTTGYGLVPNPTPFPPHDYASSSTVVAVGSKIFFIGGSNEPSTDLWILDTRSGNMTQGPSMSVPREQFDAAVGVIDGKIYVLGGGGRPKESFYEKIQVEVFDPKSETWELAGVENMRKTSRCSASVEGEVYMVEYEEINVYNPREGMVRMVSERLEKGGRRKETLKDTVDRLCVVEDVLFAFVRWNGVMWFDAKLCVWRRLVGRNGTPLPIILHETAMSEYDGRLVVLWGEDEVDNTVTKNVWCMLVSLDRCGDRVCGTVDWYGTVATVPYLFRFLHCLAVSD